MLQALVEGGVLPEVAVKLGSIAISTEGWAAGRSLGECSDKYGSGTMAFFPILFFVSLFRALDQPGWLFDLLCTIIHFFVCDDALGLPRLSTHEPERAGCTSWVGPG